MNQTRLFYELRLRITLAMVLNGILCHIMDYIDDE